MSHDLPDLVLDTKLEAEVLEKQTIHVCYVSDPTTGKRLQKVKETWERHRSLGRGTYGTVYLENCTAGKRQGKFRAVKEICRDQHDSSSTKLIRELEVIGKFSRKQVSY